MQSLRLPFRYQFRGGERDRNRDTVVRPICANRKCVSGSGARNLRMRVRKHRVEPCDHRRVELSMLDRARYTRAQRIAKCAQTLEVRSVTRYGKRFEVVIVLRRLGPPPVEVGRLRQEVAIAAADANSRVDEVQGEVVAHEQEPVHASPHIEVRTKISIATDLWNELHWRMSAPK